MYPTYLNWHVYGWAYGSNINSVAKLLTSYITDCVQPWLIAICSVFMMQSFISVIKNPLNGHIIIKINLLNTKGSRTRSNHVSATITLTDNMVLFSQKVVLRLQSLQIGGLFCLFLTTTGSKCLGTALIAKLYFAKTNLRTKTNTIYTYL